MANLRGIVCRVQISGTVRTTAFLDAKLILRQMAGLGIVLPYLNATADPQVN